MAQTILVTGNLGYVGSVLVPYLKSRGHKVIGYDTGYFEESLTTRETLVSADKQIHKDIRDIELSDLEGADAIVHLAALSNDPLGELYPGLTEDVNLGGTLRIAQLAKSKAIKRFVYASSQSMYGVSSTDAELDEDLSEKHPITAYARTKWEAELALKKMDSKDFQTVCFRPSTVFGASPRLRCDIVFNNLVACAYTTNKIEVKSDGTPWRPVVHVLDVCAAFYAGLTADEKLVAGRSFNVGIPNGNFTVRQLAEAAQKSVQGSSLVFTGEHGKDSRTYRVSFSRILNELQEYFRPSWTLDRGGAELVELFKKFSFGEEHFRGRTCNRLAQLKYLIENDKVDQKLHWTKK